MTRRLVCALVVVGLCVPAVLEAAGKWQRAIVVRSDGEHRERGRVEVMLIEGARRRRLRVEAMRATLSSPLEPCPMRLELTLKDRAFRSLVLGTQNLNTAHSKFGRAASLQLQPAGKGEAITAASGTLSHEGADWLRDGRAFSFQATLSNGAALRGSFAIEGLDCLWDVY